MSGHCEGVTRQSFLCTAHLVFVFAYVGMEEEDDIGGLAGSEKVDEYFSDPDEDDDDEEN